MNRLLVAVDIRRCCNKVSPENTNKDTVKRTAVSEIANLLASVKLALQQTQTKPHQTQTNVNQMQPKPGNTQNQTVALEHLWCLYIEGL
jgi:predicted transcriptional regulator